MQIASGSSRTSACPAWCRRLATNPLVVDDPLIALVAQIEDRAIDLIAAIPFGLLVNELVFNALEHGFGDRPHGQIRVTLSASGRGPPGAGAAAGAALPQGFEIGAAGMGPQLAASLAQQLGGTLEARNDHGAVFSADLPRLA